MDEKYNFSPETRKVFESANTGRLRDPTSNYFDKVHREYNDAVGQALDSFLERNNIRASEMRPEQARTFVDEVMRSKDPKIRNLYIRIYMREIMHGLQRFQGRE